MKCSSGRYQLTAMSLILGMSRSTGASDGDKTKKKHMVYSYSEKKQTTKIHSTQSFKMIAIHHYHALHGNDVKITKIIS